MKFMFSRYTAWGAGSRRICCLYGGYVTCTWNNFIVYTDYTIHHTPYRKTMCRLVSQGEGSVDWYVRVTPLNAVL